jgi:acyl-CoA reductase-like NAD-dependent aldehyde dehydrogenase/nicotinamidase-related amidase
LILIDLQRDFLDRGTLVPPETAMVERVAALLRAFRECGAPVFHAQTLIRPDRSNRMPHWQAGDSSACIEGTAGAMAPASIAPIAGEIVLAKPFFSAFSHPALAPSLAAHRIDTVVLAGIYTHACVRDTATDAYRLGFQVLIARDAVASTDPAHADSTLAWLEGRAASGLDADRIIAQMKASSDSRRTHAPCIPHRNPSRWNEVVAEVPVADAREIEERAQLLAAALPDWQAFEFMERRQRLSAWAESLAAARALLVAGIIRDVGKPRADAEAEIDFGLALLRHIVALEMDEGDPAAATRVRLRPHGLVGIITPWNNPFAIAVGKIAPALLFGNAVLWKPAVAGWTIAQQVHALLSQSGLGRWVALIGGEADTGRRLAECPAVRALAFTGSIEAGRELGVMCGQRQIPLQAELGGNNAVWVAGDCDVPRTANRLARAMFSFCGQRCTAPRRIIVAAGIRQAFEAALVTEIQALRLGEPGQPGVHLGPLLSRARQQRMVGLTRAALESGGKLLCGGRIPPGWDHGCWYEPTLIGDPAADSRVVQEEAFGPVAVLQTALDPDRAVALCNGVRHGLVATLFSNDRGIQEKFLAGVEAGVLSINQTPLATDPAAPFGGWKASGVGIPEHGRWDREFYTRPQAVYRAAG